MATRRRPPRRRPLRRRLRAEPGPPRDRRRGWAPRWPSTLASATSRDVAAGARHGRGLRRRPRDVRQPGRDPHGASAAWPTAASIAILGIPTEEISLDVNEIVFKMLTIRGIYGREMYETWYKMTVMLQSGLDITPAITHRFSFRDHEAAFAAARSGRRRQGDHGLDRRERRSPRGRSAMPLAADPLAHLSAELDELEGRPPLPAAAGHEHRERDPGHRRRARRDQPRLEQLPRPQHAPPARRGGGGRRPRRFGAGSGAVRTISGTMTLHEELEAALAAFKHVEAVLTFQSGFTCNTGVIPVVAGEPDLIVSDQLNHASIIDGMRLAKAPRVIYRHKDVAHLRELLADGAPRGPARRPALPGDPRRHRRRLQHGRRHRAAAGHRGGRRGVRRRRLRRRRPRLGRPGPQRPRAASTTSTSTAGSRSRSAPSARRWACSAGTWPARSSCARC